MNEDAVQKIVKTTKVKTSFGEEQMFTGLVNSGVSFFLSGVR